MTATAAPATNLQAALDFLGRGWFPIPLCWPDEAGNCGCGRGHQGHDAGKAPLLGPGYQTVRPTEADVRRWWTRWPKANIGILLEPSGLLFVGPDTPESAVWAARQPGGLPPTTIRFSRNPGYLYRRPAGCPVATAKHKPEPGIELDIKTNGYCVAHGTHQSGCEVHVDGEDLADAPQWAVELLKKSAAPTTQPPQDGNVEPPARLNEKGVLLWRGELAVDKADGRLKPMSEVSEVDRSGTLYALGCELARAGASGVSIVTALEERDRALYGKYADRRDGGLEEYRRIAKKALDATATTTTAAAATTTPTVDPDGQQKDYGHAAVLARLFKDRYRWAVHRGSWMRYDGRVWQPDAEEHVAKEAADALRQHYAAQLAAATDKATVLDLTKKVQETCLYSRITGALAFLRGWDGILTMSDEWDRDPWLLNVNNGTLDLRTGELRHHDPADLCTRLGPVDHDPNAKGPHWEQHINRFLPNPNVRRQVQRDLGRALPGVTLEESLPIWYGTGANGKTTTARALLKVLGDYADRAAPNLLVQSKYERHPTEVADLAGLRLAFSVEVDQGKHLAEALVKELTGGDRKKGRFMRQDFFSFEQTFSIVLIVNHKPIVTGTDEGIWRRVAVIPWEHRIPDAEKRPQEEVVSELVSEGPAILRWLLDGLRDWQNDHGWVAPEVRAASDAYRAEMDVLGDFIAECCILGPRYEVAKGELYQAYTTWCEDNRERPLGKKEFISRLQDRGIGERKGAKGVRLHVGIGLLTTRVAEGGADSVSPVKTEIPKGYTESAPPSATQAPPADGIGLMTDGDTFSVSPHEKSNLPGDMENLSASVSSGETKPEPPPEPPKPGIGDLVWCLNGEGCIQNHDGQPWVIEDLWEDPASGEVYAVFGDNKMSGGWPLERCEVARPEGP